MALKQTGNQSIDFVKTVAQLGLDDLHIIKHSTAQQVLTEERERLLKEIENDDVESVRDLARRVERNVSIVSRDLDVLYEADLIEFEHDGRKKKPVLAHENVLIEPVVFDGEVQAASR